MADIEIKPKNIELDVDGESFKLSYKIPSKFEQESFEAKMEELKNTEDTQMHIFEGYSERSRELKSELSELEERVKENKKLLEVESDKNEIKALIKENRELREKISNLSKELMEIKNIDFKKLESEYELLARERFEESILGDDKDRLKVFIEDGYLTYYGLLGVIHKKIDEEAKKKST